MSKILTIDTSTFVMGVAVTDGERVLGELITNSKKNHSIRLMPAIDQLMKESGVSPKDLDRIVVANGPGSYTGLRIGVTTAKTLAWSLGIPVIGVSSLALMAQVGRYFDGIVSPIIDARRGQVYTGLYTSNQQEVVGNDDRLVMLSDWLEMLARQEKQVLFVGQDVAMHQSMIEEWLGSKAQFPPYTAVLPRPSELANLSKLQVEDISTHEFLPNYHRLAEAEANWLKAQKEKGND
ncbi:tRNA (adenosine(37)-N6)-threonylcarbamoyltransferase complex dimerization subunit type 1 TsaB [bacterium LRH843]|nr:tRNA (adenosine(37)-N6)-threonylcarbamoyltransferase complex dimerization subunit type 1 TsaB [bacterium LRH843]